jgi:hypothetical protein
MQHLMPQIRRVVADQHDSPIDHKSIGRAVRSLEWCFHHRPADGVVVASEAGTLLHLVIDLAPGGGSLDQLHRGEQKRGSVSCGQRLRN